MKKTKASIIAIITLVLISGNTFAQEEESSSGEAFGDGANVIFIGFGVPPNSVQYDFKKDLFNEDDYEYKLNNYGTGVLKYEHGLHKHFGLGLSIEYSASLESYKKSLETSTIPDRESKNKELASYVRLNGHFPIIDKLDIYGGVGLGYTYKLYKYSETHTNEVLNRSKKETELTFDYQFTLGLRFMVKEKIGLFAEFGWASTPAQIGIAFKF